MTSTIHLFPWKVVIMFSLTPKLNHLTWIHFKYTLSLMLAAEDPTSKWSSGLHFIYGHIIMTASTPSGLKKDATVSQHRGGKSDFQTFPASSNTATIVCCQETGRPVRRGWSRETSGRFYSTRLGVSWVRLWSLDIPKTVRLWRAWRSSWSVPSAWRCLLSRWSSYPANTTSAENAPTIYSRWVDLTKRLGMFEPSSLHVNPSVVLCLSFHIRH